MKYLKTWDYKSSLLTFSFWLLLSPAGTVLGVEPIQSDTPQFDRLKQEFEENRVFYARFTHEYNDTFTGEQQVSEGSIWVGKEQYKMQSGNNLMVVDEDISRVYDNSKKRIIISDYIEEEDDFAPSRMLQGVDDSFSVTEAEQSNGQTLIRLTSEDPFSIFIQVTILLDSNGIPLKIEAVDQVENLLITHFNNGLFIAEEQQTFEFVYPEDAELIDLRHDI